MTRKPMQLSIQLKTDKTNRSGFQFTYNQAMIDYVKTFSNNFYWNQTHKYWTIKTDNIEAIVKQAERLGYSVVYEDFMQSLNLDTIEIYLVKSGSLETTVSNHEDNSKAGDVKMHFNFVFKTENSLKKILDNHQNYMHNISSKFDLSFSENQNLFIYKGNLDKFMEFFKKQNSFDVNYLLFD